MEKKRIPIIFIFKNLIILVLKDLKIPSMLKFWKLYQRRYFQWTFKFNVLLEKLAMHRNYNYSDRHVTHSLPNFFSYWFKTFKRIIIYIINRRGFCESHSSLTTQPIFMMKVPFERGWFLDVPCSPIKNANQAIT